jgi:hypothetical protein
MNVKTVRADLVQLANSSLVDPQNPFPWQQCFQAALQGTTGQGGMTNKQKVDLAAQMATASTKHLFGDGRLTKLFDCCRGKATNVSVSDQFSIHLGFTATWGKGYFGALQTTSGQTTNPADAVKKAQGIADTAMVAAFDDEAMAIFKDCAKANP